MSLTESEERGRNYVRTLTLLPIQSSTDVFLQIPSFLLLFLTFCNIWHFLGHFERWGNTLRQGLDFTPTPLQPFLSLSPVLPFFVWTYVRYFFATYHNIFWDILNLKGGGPHYVRALTLLPFHCRHFFLQIPAFQSDWPRVGFQTKIGNFHSAPFYGTCEFSSNQCR